MALPATTSVDPTICTRSRRSFHALDDEIQSASNSNENSIVSDVFQDSCQRKYLKRFGSGAHPSSKRPRNEDSDISSLVNSKYTSTATGRRRTQNHFSRLSETERFENSLAREDETSADIDRKSLCSDEQSKRVRKRNAKKIKKRTSSRTFKNEDIVCLICMDPFTQKNPRSAIPCSKKCNSAPVHARCIYEWRESRSGNDCASCPLCRSRLERINYLPPDIIRSSTFDNFVCRKSFLVHPVPREAGVVRCYIKAMRTGLFGTTAYELYLQAPTTLKYPLGPLPDQNAPREGDRLLAVARKRLTQYGYTQLDISMDPTGSDLDEFSQTFLGTVQSSFSGLDHTILAPHRFKDGRMIYCELGAVRYTQNRIRSTVGPRRVQVCLPSIQRIGFGSEEAIDSAPVIIPTPSSGSYGYKTINVENLVSGCAFATSELVGEDAKVLENANDCETDDSELVENKSETASRWATKVHVAQGKDSLSQRLKKGIIDCSNLSQDIMFAKNKEPYWLDAIQAYSLDFQGRVTLPSNKNFQLLMQDNSALDRDMDNHSNTNNELEPKSQIVLQFGKVEDNQMVEIYTMDVKWPLSPLQAFGISLSACDRKLLCA